MKVACGTEMIDVVTRQEVEDIFREALDSSLQKNLGEKLARFEREVKGLREERDKMAAQLRELKSCLERAKGNGKAIPVGIGVRIKSCRTGKYLSLGGVGSWDSRPVSANVTSPDSCEIFVVEMNRDKTFSIRSKGFGKYVTAECDRDGQLNARAERVQGWEKFCIEDVGEGHCAIMSIENSKYVCIGGDERLSAAGGEIAHDAELFDIMPA